MKNVFVDALVPNETVTSQFLVTFKEIRQKKTGEPYLSLMLADRTGEIEAKMWDNVAEVMTTFDRDDFVKVKGVAQVYQNRYQFTIHRIRALQDHEIEPGDYFPCSSRSGDEMFAELTSVIDSFRNEHLKQLLQTIFADERIAGLYKRAPAAKSIHHACLGGLIEHVLSLCGLCRAVAAHYKTLDLDLLLAAAILHDIGKIEELKFERSFSYTAAGQLVGHIVIGVGILNDAIRKLPDFPSKLKLLLEHIILSHHGTLEFGSPKVPLFPEALVFHQLDNLDSKFESMRLATERDKQPDSDFTAWIPSLERVVLKKERFLSSLPVEPVSAPPETTDTAPLNANETSRPEATSSRAELPDGKRPVKPAPRPTPGSPFAEKLQAVLGLGKDSPQSNN